jgi:hypothetical protein
MRVRGAVRRHSQVMAVCCVANCNEPLHLVQSVQPLLAEHHILHLRQSQNFPHTVPC